MSKEVVISNSRLNSYGFRVLTEGLDLEQYKKNPILLWMHNRPWRGTTNEVLPLGRIENLRIDGDNLIGTPVFDEQDEFAKQIKQKWEGGFLKMVSAGFEVIEVSDAPEVILQGQRRSTVTKAKLIEVSIVDIGANDDALVLYKDGKTVTLSAGNDSDFPTLIKQQSNTDQKMKAIALKLGLPETASEQEVLAKIGELQTTAQGADAARQELAKQKDAAIDAAVENAIKLRKITADKKAHFVELGKKAGLETLTETLNCMSSSQRPTDVINNGSSGTEYKTLRDVPTDKLEELRKEDFETYSKLYKAAYGIEPKKD